MELGAQRQELEEVRSFQHTIAFFQSNISRSIAHTHTHTHTRTPHPHTPTLTTKVKVAQAAE